jgi:hypothetical protein
MVQQNRLRGFPERDAPGRDQLNVDVIEDE